MEKEHNKSIEKMSKFERELGTMLEANKILQDDFYREKLLRKRFYNMVEELKGKIRVFCRIRPVAKNEKTSEVIAQPSDPYTVSLETTKGHKEFQFDRVFTSEESQEQVFCDTQVILLLNFCPAKCKKPAIKNHYLNIFLMHANLVSCIVIAK